MGGEEYKDRKRKKTEISSSFMAIMYYASKRKKKMRTAGRPSLATLEKRNRDDGRDGEKEEEEDETRELIEREIVGVILFI